MAVSLRSDDDLFSRYMSSSGPHLIWRKALEQGARNGQSPGAPSDGSMIGEPKT